MLTTPTTDRVVSVGDDDDPADGTHRFRGRTLDDACAAATAELGPDHEVVAANRIRRGGVGGFFATDLGVEVIVRPVEVPPARFYDREVVAEDESVVGRGLVETDLGNLGLAQLLADVTTSERDEARQFVNATIGHDDTFARHLARAERSSALSIAVPSPVSPSPWPIDEHDPFLPVEPDRQARPSSEPTPSARSRKTNQSTTTVRKPNEEDARSRPTWDGDELLVTATEPMCGEAPIDAATAVTNAAAFDLEDLLDRLDATELERLRHRLLGDTMRGDAPLEHPRPAARRRRRESADDEVRTLARRDPLRRPTELARVALAAMLDEAATARTRNDVGHLTVSMTMPDGVKIELRAELGGQ